MISAFIHKFSSPKSFVQITKTLYPLFIFTGLSMLIIGWTWGLLFAPPDAVQGNSYRIIFLHVPAVIFAELIYFFMALCALMHIVWRVRLAAYLIKSAAPIGAMITFIGLFSVALSVNFLPGSYPALCSTESGLSSINRDYPSHIFSSFYFSF